MFRKIRKTLAVWRRIAIFTLFHRMIVVHPYNKRPRRRSLLRPFRRPAGDHGYMASVRSPFGAVAFVDDDGHIHFRW